MRKSEIRIEYFRQMIYNKTLQWLLDGDISIQYQVYRDLLDEDKPELRREIHKKGWAGNFISKQNDDGHWGRGYYNPKWISTHYTLLDLRNLWVDPGVPSIRKIITKILKEEKGRDGGINPSGTINNSDVCINGMALNFCSYFSADQDSLNSVIDFILSQKMPDGGYNCQLNRKGAVHSSLHSTISVLEGMREYIRNNYTYRIEDIMNAEREGQEFILSHRLYRSDKTGRIIKESFLRFPYPYRWYYDILRALDYFRIAGSEFDIRMNDAIETVRDKKDENYKWKLNAKYPGKEHLSMEKPGNTSRWNTLRAWRVLKWFNCE